MVPSAAQRFGIHFMIIMGIDPGLASTGVGVVEEIDGKTFRALHFEDVKTSASTPLADRLGAIHALVRKNIDRFKPQVLAIESVFFAKNVRSVVMMAHGRGAAILTAAQSGIEVIEYSPLEIKQSVVGKGRATKEQVSQMVTIILNLPEAPRSDHQADALACALCHALRTRSQRPAATISTSMKQDTNKLLLAQMKRGRRKRR